MDPPEGGASQLRDVGRTVSGEAMTHLKKLRDSERAKEWTEKSVAWTADALDDPGKTWKSWTEDEKVAAWKEKGKSMLDNALLDEEKMEKAREVLFFLTTVLFSFAPRHPRPPLSLSPLPAVS